MTNIMQADHCVGSGQKMKTILITSVKGGVGKSTVTAGLGAALAAMGKRVLICDLDLGNPSLDLICGCEDNVLLDLGDVVCRGVPPESALISLREERLWLLPAPRSAGYTESGFGDTVNADAANTDKAGGEAVHGETAPPDCLSCLIPALGRLLRDTGGAVSADYLLLDTPGHTGDIVKAAARCADAAIVVSTQQPAALRGAQTTALLLSMQGVEDVRLVVNRFDFPSAADGRRSDLLSMIDGIGLRLAAVIPEDRVVGDAQHRGLLVDEQPFMRIRGGRLKPLRDIAAAYINLALRADRSEQPLFEGFKRKRSRRRSLGIQGI